MNHKDLAVFHKIFLKCFKFIYFSLGRWFAKVGDSDGLLHKKIFSHLRKKDLSDLAELLITFTVSRTSLTLAP